MEWKKNLHELLIINFHNHFLLKLIMKIHFSLCQNKGKPKKSFVYKLKIQQKHEWIWKAEYWSLVKRRWWSIGMIMKKTKVW